MSVKIKMEELIIEVDENDKKIGLRPRSDFLTGKYIHRVSHLILLNSRNEMLIQLRAKDKKLWPNLYTYSVDGTVANETYEECILREMQEELGVKVDVEKLFTYTYNATNDKTWRCVFTAKSDEDINFDKREIQSIKWISLNDLKKDILDNPDVYVEPFVKGMEIFFEKYK